MQHAAWALMLTSNGVTFDWPSFTISPNDQRIKPEDLDGPGTKRSTNSPKSSAALYSYTLFTFNTQASVMGQGTNTWVLGY
jgi:hypothetical protein